MPGSIIDWTTTRAMAGTSSFGFSGTNSHGTLEAPKNGEGRDVPLERALECTESLGVLESSQTGSEAILPGICISTQ